MKSRLRSRWYRANEKPLEKSSTKSQNQEPFGEIISTDEKLVDDLSNAKPSQHMGNENRSPKRERPDQRNSPRDRSENHRSQKSRTPNHRQTKRQEDQRGASPDVSTAKGENKNKENNSERESYSKKNKPRRRKQNHSKNRTNEKRKKTNFNQDKGKAPKRSALGSFLSKLFGG